MRKQGRLGANLGKCIQRYKGLSAHLVKPDNLQVKEFPKKGPSTEAPKCRIPGELVGDPGISWQCCRLRV